MRITGGEFSGRRLRAPVGRSVRPTQDRVREALFNRLAARLPGCRFVDLFAGSGAVGLEALSRGAAQVIWVERDPRVWRGLRENVQAFARNPQTIICADVFRWLEGPAGRTLVADIVFADPPYAQHDHCADLPRTLAHPGRMREGGLLIVELPAEAPPLHATPPWTLLDSRLYGQTQLCCLQLGTPLP